MDAACIRESEEYGPQLLTKFAELLGQVGTARAITQAKGRKC